MQRRLPPPYKVYVGLVPTGYLNAEKIQEIVREGILFCGLSKKIERLRSFEPVLLKADVGMADRTIAPYAYTHPEIIRAVARQISGFSPSARFSVLARSSMDLPTRLMLKRAHGNTDLFQGRGYFELEHLFPGRLNVVAAEESRQCRYQLAKGDVLGEEQKIRLRAEATSSSTAAPLNRLLNEVTASQHYYESRFSVFCPKLKTSALTEGFSGAVALGGADWSSENPGADAFFQDHKLCDMLELCNPDLIVSDGIVAAVGGNHLTQKGHELGVILISNNAVAHDWVATRILNLNFEKINHLKIASERGWGPVQFSQIEIGGAGADACVQLAQKSKFWDNEFIPVQKFSKKYEKENPGCPFPVEILAGEPIEHGGAHGALLDWLHASCDNAATRQAISDWPKASVLAGGTTQYPAHQLIYVLGERAKSEFQPLISKQKSILNSFGLSLSRVQLKNGRKHFAIFVAFPNLKSLGLAFYLGSLGRMTNLLTRPRLHPARLLASIQTLWSRAQNAPAPQIVMTSRMPQNAWWALRPTLEIRRSQIRRASSHNHAGQQT